MKRETVSDDYWKEITPEKMIKEIQEDLADGDIYDTLNTIENNWRYVLKNRYSIDTRNKIIACWRVAMLGGTYKKHKIILDFMEM